MNFAGRKQFLLFAFWLGFVGFITSMIGMLMDPRAYPLEVGYIFAVSGIIWIIMFVFIVVVTSVYAAFYRFLRK